MYGAIFAVSGYSSLFYTSCAEGSGGTGEKSGKTPGTLVAVPKKYRVGVLGATGTVGQQFLKYLDDHPWFEVRKLGASERSSGSKYGTIVNWQQGGSVPTGVTDAVVTTCDPGNFRDCDLVFSALDASVAGEVEIAFAEAGVPVFSNARNHRMAPDVPLVVPNVNGDHMDVVRHQKWFSRGGFIVTNANCSTTGLTIALKPLVDAFGIESAVVVTMQAISGAGYPGVPSLDILDNVVPYISGEEDKLETEYKKILGSVSSRGATHFVPLDFPLTAHASRVMVRDGHTLCVSLKLKKTATVEDVKAALAGYQPFPEIVKELPSAPRQTIVVLDQPNRPQPRMDRDTGKGFTTVVGRIRPDPLMTVKFVVLSHNTVMGAAGSSILNAELAVAKEPKGMLCPPPLPDDEEDVWVVASVSQDVMTAIQVSGAPPTLKYSTDGSVIELNVGEVSMTGKQEPLLGRTLLVSAGVPPVLRPVDDEKYVVPALSCQSSGVMVKFASSTEAARFQEDNGDENGKDGSDGDSGGDEDGDDDGEND